MAPRHTGYELHDHAGVRWLAPFVVLLLLTVVGLLLMLVYPHAELAGGI